MSKVLVIGDSCKDIFIYGDIERIKVLSDKTDRNMCRDIAFLDFVYPSDANSLLNSGERFVIQHFILNLEKSRK